MPQVQDPDFLKASPQDQHAYLMATDPDYAKAAPNDQLAFRAHVNQQVPTEGQAAATPPTAPMPQKPSELRQSDTISDSLSQNVQGQPIAPLGATSVPRFIGGLLGGYGGSKAGEYTGNKFNLSPDAKKATQYGGSILGSILGAGSGARMEDAIGPFVKNATLEAPAKIDLPGGFKINRNVPPEEPTVQPISQSPYYNKILAARAADRSSARAALKSDASTSPNLPFLPGGGGSRPVTPLIGTPEEWAASDQQQRILANEARNAGRYSAARGKVGAKVNYQERIGRKFGQ